MTTLQITKALTKTGFSLQGIKISTDKIEVNVSSDERKNSRLLSKICKANKFLGHSFMTGYGSWILRINGTSNYLVSNNID